MSHISTFTPAEMVEYFSVPVAGERTGQTWEGGPVAIYGYEWIGDDTEERVNAAVAAGMDVQVVELNAVAGDRTPQILQSMGEVSWRALLDTTGDQREREMWALWLGRDFARSLGIEVDAVSPFAGVLGTGNDPSIKDFFESGRVQQWIDADEARRRSLGPGELL